MPQKIQSEIVKINLNDATFQGTGASIKPTCVNYFFGSNGTGKSTIAKAIKSGRGLTFADGKRFEDYIPLVYDQDFIDDNMRSYHELKGIFTFDEVNSEIQEEADRLNAQLTDARCKKIAAETEKAEAERKLSEFDEKSMRRQYTALKGLRDQFGKLIQSRFSSSKILMPEIRRHVANAAKQDENEMKRQYDAIYGNTAREYKEFPVIQDTEVLDRVDDAEILGVVIANAAQTGFARFLERIDATEWVRQAHGKYHETAEGRCPYCYRELQPDFEKMFTDSFDDQYDRNIRRLHTFLEEYRRRANVLFLQISKLPDEVYPGADVRAYREKLGVLRAAIAGNIETIRSKIAEPAKIVTLVDISSILDVISEMADEINRMIRSNNAAFNARAEMAAELREHLFCHMAYVMQWDFKIHDQSKKLISDNIETQKKIISEQAGIIAQLRESLRGKKGSIKDTSYAMKNINDMLRNANFQGFELRPHMDAEQQGQNGKVINYEVVRTDTGKIAVDLSEGERNFIAFLYFLQKVFGSESEHEDTREKIVVIDDPVSGMDSSTLYVVSEQIRRMVEVCRNNIDNRNAVVKGNFIKQIFIFTHNAYFHREVTYPHADRYEFVSFYLVRKQNNTSSIRLCDKKNPEKPSERMNVNPVRNSYAALWEEYREVSSPAPLMNVIRRILEYYFVQFCGYEENRLREIILEENRDAFTRDGYGNEDNARYETASAMLSYIGAASYGVNDDLHYVDDGADVELYRETFHMIFEHMHQEQHYNMMMGIKNKERISV